MESKRIDDHKVRVLILANPKAGSGYGREQLAEFATLAENAGYPTEIISHPEEFSAKIHRAFELGELRAAVAAGGDGTAEYVATLCPPTTPILLFPLGTENLLAKHLGLTNNPSDALRILQDGRIVCMDAAKANDKIFLIMLGCGFDAEVVRRVHRARQGHISHWAYAKPILGAMRSYRYPPIRVRCLTSDQSKPEVTIEAHWAFVFNVPSYAGGLGICPDADPFDGQLDVVTFEGGSIWHGLYHLSSIMLGRHRLSNEVRTIRCHQVELFSTTNEVNYQVDGDPGGTLPVSVHALPGHVHLFVPADYLPS